MRLIVLRGYGLGGSRAVWNRRVFVSARQQLVGKKMDDTTNGRVNDEIQGKEKRTAGTTTQLFRNAIKYLKITDVVVLVAKHWRRNDF